MSLAAGTRLGIYEILAPIGAGGMGEVYRARDAKLNRDVAVKILPAALAQDPGYLARFQREAQVLASLNHPNIAQIYGLEQDAIVMELVEGESPRGPMPVADAIAIARQVAEGLEAAHEKGIVHRDLKPANIKVTPAGVVKILDFGLAKAYEPASASSADSPTLTIRSTQAGLILGTAGYMAPEQAAGKAVDKRADIWAFGVVLHELLSGTRLFDGETVSHTLAAVLKDPIEVDSVPAPSAVRALLRRCLDRDMKTRLRDIGEARVALSAPTVESPAAAATPARRAVWPWIAIASLLAACIPLVWILKRAPEAPLMQLEILPPAGVSMGPPTWGQFRVSPDGRAIAFAARDRDGENKIFLRDLAAGTTTAIAGTEQGRGPIWSPDSRQLAFFAEGQLKRIELAGNRVAVVSDAPSGVFGMWHGDGNLYMSSQDLVLRKVRASGGTMVPAVPTAAEGKMLMSTPATIPGASGYLAQIQGPPSKGLLISPDGTIRKQVLPQAASACLPVSYAVNPAGGGVLLHRTEAAQLAAVSMDPRTGDFLGEEVLIAQDVPAGPSWSASDTGILAYRKLGWGADRRLTWVERNGAQGASIAQQGNVYVQRISPDQKQVAFSRLASGGAHVYVHDLQRGTTTRLSVESSRNAYAVWTPDSRSLIYEVGREAIAEHAVDGSSGEKILLRPSSDLRPTDVSRDGKWLASVSVVVGVQRVVLTSLETGKNIRFGEDMKVNTRDGAFSPDGKWLLFSAFVNGRWDVFVRPVPAEMSGKPADSGAVSAGQLQISSAGGSQPMWRADGKEIFYIAASGMMTAIPVEVTTASVRPGTPAPLFATPLGLSETFQREYDATADGRRFLLSLSPSGVQSEMPITVIVNWPRLLEKK